MCWWGWGGARVGGGKNCSLEREHLLEEIQYVRCTQHGVTASSMELHQRNVHSKYAFGMQMVYCGVQAMYFYGVCALKWFAALMQTVHCSSGMQIKDNKGSHFLLLIAVASI